MKLLICGTRMKLQDSMKAIIANKIREQAMLNDPSIVYGAKFEIIEGCCPGSADEIAEIVAKEDNIPIEHFPANSGNYLKRNVEMVQACDEVLAFWDGWSYGTAHTIATAISLGKIARVVLLK